MIFEPYDLRGLKLRNRMVMAPMTRCRATNPDHLVNELIVKYYVQRATAGLIVSEPSFVSEDAVGAINAPALYSEEQVEAWSKVTTAVHEKGTTIFAQLWHTGSHSHPDLLGGKLPLAPSAVNPNGPVFTPEGFKPTVTPRQMSLADIKQTVADVKQAAVNAFKAGFDGIEIHGANGYLLQQFFNKDSNRRTDLYGGSIENRARILFDILDAMKEVVDCSRIGVRLSPSLDGLLGVVADDETIALYDYIVDRLNEYELAYVHLLRPFTDVSNDRNVVHDVAHYYRRLFKGTLIINGGFTKETAEQVLAAGDADLVSFGQPFLANPDLVKRFELNAPLNQPDRNTLYTPGETGYTDYPFLEIKTDKQL